MLVGLRLPAAWYPLAPKGRRRNKRSSPKHEHAGIQGVAARIRAVVSEIRMSGRSVVRLIGFLPAGGRRLVLAYLAVMSAFLVVGAVLSAWLTPKRIVDTPSGQVTVRDPMWLFESPAGLGTLFAAPVVVAAAFAAVSKWPRFEDE